MFEKINEKLVLEKEMNAFIVTPYKSGQDNIGFTVTRLVTSRRIASFFVVFKLGQARPFEFT